ncbi:hypothetical protein [Pedobacter psychroterrae]|uniref:Uncharacterized protein n=1 Tax=Pedobacter psychroterrae TaxID=2530453 RepID=A0A4R0NLH9_9SPHI|nr:hypothetical protein [Pedobacter psychroterrae]TCD01682.1 hypothetical protein EZ437_13265 [Pedobacter psychroterrae]
MKRINKRNQVIKNEAEESSENLGLDADHSSEGDTLNSRLNDDNNRITGNPGGENDIKDEDNHAICSPLDQK